MLQCSGKGCEKAALQRRRESACFSVVGKGWRKLCCSVSMNVYASMFKGNVCASVL